MLGAYVLIFTSRDTAFDNTKTLYRTLRPWNGPKSLDLFDIQIILQHS
jgi:hypothetical protein